MWIGYLQLGPPEHGICRYGKLLAAEGRKRPNFTITEVNINLTKDRKHNQEMLISAARQLSEAEIIHIQYSGKNNQPLWGNSWEQLYYFWLFKYHCSRPIVVTLHDVYNPPLNIKTVLKRAYQRFKNITSNDETSVEPNEPAFAKLPRSKATKTLKRIFGTNALAFNWLLNQAKLVFVCSWEEAHRLRFVAEDKTRVIPHFVEERTLTNRQTESRANLQLDGSTTVTILGFIHGRKGYQLMVETMPKLPEDVRVVFAGGASPGNEKFVEELIQLAKAKGVSDRLRITGYLSEEELEQYLIATDLAVCPFKFFSASGSLSTWISAARPILAYDLPQIAEYNLLEPGAIKTFHSYDSEVLADAIKQLLSVTSQPDDPRIVRLREQLSISRIFDKQVDYYHQVTTGSKRTPIKLDTLKH
jgi:glycosyltransferase involved in cell wall biosynthesis